MTWKPRADTDIVLDRAWAWIQSVSYRVTARWVFYRLLQDGTYGDKKGYKHLLAVLSRARKEFYKDWRPWSLADDTRAAILMQRSGYYGLHFRGSGFDDEEQWLSTVADQLNCQLNRWRYQPVYTEIWYEAAAMQGQFLEYANENVPLLAFKGDFTIGPKWTTAQRLAERYIELGGKPITIYYYGDLDQKGKTIPQSAWKDIYAWMVAILRSKSIAINHDVIRFKRIGINQDQIANMNIPENPERPGTYQWEGLDDAQAEELIGKATEDLDLVAFEDIRIDEEEIRDRFRKSLKKLLDERGI